MRHEQEALSLSGSCFVHLKVVLVVRKQGQSELPPQAVIRKVEVEYVRFNLLTDLDQKREGTNVRTASGILLEGRKKTTKRVVQLKEWLPDF